MKKLIALCLFSAGAAMLTAAPANAAAKSATGKKSAPAPQKTAAAQAGIAVPVKPVVPEKKQPFELWMTAQSQAQECIRNKKYDEALKFYDQAEKEANKGIWKNYTLYEKAQLLVLMNRPGEALELLRKKLSRDRNTPYHKARTALMRGEILANAQRYDEAAAEFNAALSSNLNNWVTADAALGLGGICEVNKDLAGAEKYYKNLLADTTRLPGLRLKGLMAQVRMLEKNNRISEALAFLDAHCNIEQLPPDSVAQLQFRRSELKLALKDITGAREALQQAMRIPGRSAPWVAGAFTRLAKISYMQKRYQDAQNLMRRSKSVRGAAWGYESEFHNQVNAAVAKQNRERLIRERKIRQEREKKLRMERQRKAKLERERKKNERNVKKSAK